jgi:5'-nucleotidase
MTLIGDQLDTLPEQQWCRQTSLRILQMSAGFSYAWDATRPATDRADRAPS